MVNFAGNVGQNQFVSQFDQINKQQIKANMEMGAIHKANAEVKKFEESPKPNKNNLNMNAAAKLLGVSLLAIASKLIYDQDFVKNNLNAFGKSVKGHADSIMESIKAPLRKIGSLKTAKDFVVQHSSNALEWLKNIPGPVKFIAAAAASAIVIKRAYDGGHVDGEHKAVNNLGKAEAYEKMGNALQNLNQVV
ncbi:MAG: hypothetical protein WCK67_10490 [bacterium]